MYKLELNEKEVNLVLQSLGKQPAEIVIDIILNIKNQCAKQIKDDDKTKG